ncbi:MAG: hypothetical protein LGB03_06495 [Sulfurovum sp.]|nr:hypothetical protein [Sulfurovum sp.]
MKRCEEIVANVRMEECYAGLSLVFDDKRTDLKEKIDVAIEKTCQQTGLKPLVFNNTNTDQFNHEAFYVEFTDEAQRESGAFFEALLGELNIDKCVNDVIKEEYRL